eukprot:COSAG02_NODE_51_length_44689_cov_29.477361_20_plen_89_part_00
MRSVPATAAPLDQFHTRCMRAILDTCGVVCSLYVDVVLSVSGLSSPQHIPAAYDNLSLLIGILVLSLLGSQKLGATVRKMLEKQCVTA